MNKNWPLLILIALFSACSSDSGNFQIGDDLVDSESSVTLVDTFSVQLSTVVLDSIITSDPDAALVGKYSDPTIGTTELKHYFNVDLASNYGSLDEDDDIFDSITVKLQYNGFSLGDTISDVTFNLYRLTEELELIEDENYNEYLYNNSSFPYEETPIGSYTFRPNPNSLDSIEFRIDDAFGEEILNWIYNDEQSETKNDRFMEYLKGFVLVADDANSNVILGFDNSDASGIALKVYSHVVDLDIEENEYEFQRTADALSFNQVIANREETLFADLPTQRTSTPSSETDGLTFMQGTTGVLTRVDFPNLNDVFATQNRVVIRAELILVPAVENRNLSELPSTLNLYSTNHLNAFSTNNILTVTSGSSTQAVNARLVSDPLTDEYYYIVDITTYLRSVLANNYYDNELGLLVSVPQASLYNQADPVILTDGFVGELQPKLNLYFLIYE